REGCATEHIFVPPSTDPCGSPERYWQSVMMTVRRKCIEHHVDCGEHGVCTLDQKGHPACRCHDDEENYVYGGKLCTKKGEVLPIPSEYIIGLCMGVIVFLLVALIGIIADSYFNCRRSRGRRSENRDGELAGNRDSTNSRRRDIIRNDSASFDQPESLAPPYEEIELYRCRTPTPPYEENPPERRTPPPPAAASETPPIEVMSPESASEITPVDFVSAEASNDAVPFRRSTSERSAGPSTSLACDENSRETSATTLSDVATASCVTDDGARASETLLSDAGAASSSCFTLENLPRRIGLDKPLHFKQRVTLPRISTRQNFRVSDSDSSSSDAWDETLSELSDCYNNRPHRPRQRRSSSSTADVREGRCTAETYRPLSRTYRVLIMGSLGPEPVFLYEPWRNRDEHNPRPLPPAADVRDQPPIQPPPSYGHCTDSDLERYVPNVLRERRDSLYQCQDPSPETDYPDSLSDSSGSSDTVVAGSTESDYSARIYWLEDSDSDTTLAFGESTDSDKASSVKKIDVSRRLHSCGHHRPGFQRGSDSDSALVFGESTDSARELSVEKNDVGFAQSCRRRPGFQQGHPIVSLKSSAGSDSNSSVKTVCSGDSQSFGHRSKAKEDRHFKHSFKETLEKRQSNLYRKCADSTTIDKSLKDGAKCNHHAEKTVTGYFDTDKKVTGDFDTYREVIDDFDTDKIVPGDYDSDKTLTGDFDSDKTLTGDFDFRKTVAGNLDSDKTVTGDLESDKTVTGDLDSDKTVAGDLESDKTVAGDLDSDKTVADDDTSHTRRQPDQPDCRQKHTTEERGRIRADPQRNKSFEFNAETNRNTLHDSNEPALSDKEFLADTSHSRELSDAEDTDCCLTRAAEERKRLRFCPQRNNAFVENAEDSRNTFHVSPSRSLDRGFTELGLTKHNSPREEDGGKLKSVNDPTVGCLDAFGEMKKDIPESSPSSPDPPPANQMQLHTPAEPSVKNVSSPSITLKDFGPESSEDTSLAQGEGPAACEASACWETNVVEIEDRLSTKVMTCRPAAAATSEGEDQKLLDGVALGKDHEPCTRKEGTDNERRAHEDGAGTEVCRNNDRADTEPCAHNEGADTEPCAHNEGADTKPRAHNKGPDTEPCAHNEGADTEPCAQNEGADTELCAHNEGADTEPCAHNEGADTEPCAHNEGADTEPRTHNKGVDTEPCAHNERTDTEPCAHNERTDTEPCAHNAGADTEPCTHNGTDTLHPRRTSTFICERL
ncbi:hypothetical protein BaRGS_00031981, partial [Batillaria attramentaria]